MIKKILIASNNNGKIMEFKAMLSALMVEIVTPKDFGLTEPEETGETFFDNSLIKARHCFEVTKIPTIADDSGMCIVSLNNEPGVYSARYFEHFGGDIKLVSKVLNERLGESSRAAYFYCSLVFVDGNQVSEFVGQCDGSLSYSPLGENGHGYDPIFIPQGYRETFAQLSPEIKNKISHRGKANNKFVDFLKEFNA